MAKVMKLPNLENHVSRNGFDLSFRTLFSDNCGEIMPVNAIPIFPGDKMKFECGDFARTAPVNTAAYQRFKSFYDFIFVPYSVLWNQFGNFITDMQVDSNQYASSLVSGRLPSSKVPHVSTKDLSTYINRLKQSNSKNVFGFSDASNVIRLLDGLDYGYFAESLTNVDSKVNEELEALTLAAYQKSYYDHYRFDQWEDYKPHCCNFDYLNGTNTLVPISTLPIGGIASDNLLTLRYSNFERDLLFGILPEQQLGDTSVVQLNIDSKSYTVGSFLEVDKKTTQPGTLTSPSPLNQYQSFSPIVQSATANFHLSAAGVANLGKALNSNFDILQLRAAEYLQKYKEIANCNDRDVKSQIEAFWGVKVPAIVSHRSIFVDSIQGSISINEAINTNLTGGASADIQGVGRGSADGTVYFDNNKYGNEHGVLLILHRVIPLLDYRLTGARSFHKNILYGDFPNPAFDKLGYQPNNYLDYFNDNQTKKQFGTLSDGHIGFVPRYAEYKTNIDTVKGAFRESSALAAWVAPVTSQQMITYVSVNQPGVNVAVSHYLFKINPHMCDTIFNPVSDDYATHHFFTAFAAKVDAVRNFDYNGLPY